MRLVSLFNKPKTVGEVAKTLPEQLNFLKLVMLEQWSDAMGINPKSYSSSDNDEQIEMITYMGQCINYWFAEDPNDINQNLPAEQINRIKRIQEIVPIKSHEALEQNKDFRKAIVYALRMKLVLNMSLHSKDWHKSDEGKRVTALLDRYGNEFPEKVTDRKFDKLVNRIARYQNLKRAISK